MLKRKRPDMREDKNLGKDLEVKINIHLN